MKILVIDSSENYTTVAVFDQDGLRVEYSLQSKNTVLATLFPQIFRCISDLNTTLDTINLIGIIKGPGSFTGLRIGVTTAKTLAQSLDCRLVGISALDALAENVNAVGGFYKICAIMDARRNNVYAALYEMNQDRLVEQGKHQLISIKTLCERLKDDRDKILFVGSGALLHRETIITTLGNTAQITSKYFSRIRGSSIAAIALRSSQYYLEGKQCFGLVPMYMQETSAEINYKRRRAKIC